MAQASRQREKEIEASPTQMEIFYDMHHDEYIPVQHAMMALSLLGMVSVLHSLWARWPSFKHKNFSPAHMAFVFPLLSHTNAIQAYRAGVDTFAGIPEGSPFKIVVSYLCYCLMLCIISPPNYSVSSSAIGLLV